MHFPPVCVCTAGPAPMWEPSHWINVCRAAWEQSFVYVTVKMSWKLQQPSVSVLHDSPVRSGKARIMNYIMEYKYFIFREKVPSLWHCSFTSSRHFLIHTLYPPLSLTHKHTLSPPSSLPPSLHCNPHTLLRVCVSAARMTEGLWAVQCVWGVFFVCVVVCVCLSEKWGVRVSASRGSGQDNHRERRLIGLSEYRWCEQSGEKFFTAAHLIWSELRLRWISSARSDSPFNGAATSSVLPLIYIYIFFIFFVAVDSLCVTGLDTITCITVLHSGGFDKAAD